MSSTADLLHRLRQFVQAEAEMQYSALDRQWSRPIGERVARGWAIEGLRFVSEDKGIVRLECTNNDSRFREGDLLVLHQGTDTPKSPNALHVELQYDGETELEVSVIKGNQYFLKADPYGWIADQDWFDASSFYLDALDAVADSLRGRSTILPLLNGSLETQMDYARYERAAAAADEAGLNASQIEAVAQAYATNRMHLIQGPPGTGKTWVLAQLARLLVEDGQRVLVTALTHRAIHNALNKIPTVDDSLPVCKIGSGRLCGDLEVPNYEEFDQSGFSDLSGGYIVGATPFAIQTRRLANVEFDVVLFDEASQITLPLAIMGMLAGGKYIFIGDENQLPPVTVFAQEDEPEKASQLSVFSFLSGRGDETMLNITYRLNDVLSDWPSRTFYQGELVPSAEAAGRRLKLSERHTRWDFILDPQDPAVFVDLCHRNTTVRSRTEAELCVELILALLDHSVSPEEIGVVVPYRAQSRLIRSLLRRQILDEPARGKLVVDTVERMQGQEREVVLVSFATASPAFALQVANFLFKPQRLNVAVTRPRTKLILIGSHHMMEGEAWSDESLPEDAADTGHLLRDLLDSCFRITLPEGRLV
jgi:DNA replication ATP-dependent helicase Dna2